MPSTVEQIITKARVQIFMDHGFFGHILAKHEIHVTDRVSTLAVDGKRNIYVNPDFVLRFKDDNKQIQWALCHEIMHPVLNHLTRRGKRDPKRWNYAGDAIINDLLNTTGVGKRIPGTVHIPGSSAKTTEQVYNELGGNDGDDDSDGRGDSTDGSGGSGDAHDNGLGDDIIESDMSESEIRAAEAQAKIDIAEAATSARARGALPGALNEFVRRILDSEIPWYDKLHQFMQGLTNANSTWARPNRRFIARGDYLPSVGREPAMGEIVIQIDISLSVSPAEQAHFAGHVQRIMAECYPSKVHVLYTDVKVREHHEFDSADDVEFKFLRGGGTDMTAGYEFCDEHGIHPDVFVTLSDGGTPFGREQSYPSVWCLSDPNIQAPHGVTIPFKVKEQ